MHLIRCCGYLFTAHLCTRHFVNLIGIVNIAFLGRILYHPVGVGEGSVGDEFVRGGLDRFLLVGIQLNFVKITGERKTVNLAPDFLFIFVDSGKYVNRGLCVVAPLEINCARVDGCIQTALHIAQTA